MIALGIILISIGLAFSSWSIVNARKCKQLQSTLSQQISQNNNYFDDIVHQLIDLADRERQVGAMVEIIQKETIDNKHRSQYIQQQQDGLNKLIANNNKIVNTNQMYLYNIKESLLNTIQDYRKANSLLSKILYSPEASTKLEELVIQMRLKTIGLEDNFTHNFQMSPDQYKTQKMKSNNNFSVN